MISRDDTIKLVARLGKLTQDGELRWHRYPGGLHGSRLDVISQCHVTNVGGENIGIIEGETRSYDGERDVVVYETAFEMAILDGEYVRFHFPEVPGLKSLADAVHYQAGDIGSWVKKLMQPK